MKLSLQWGAHGKALGRYEVTAYATDAPGLFVHRPIAYAGKTRGKVIVELDTDNGWVLSHHSGIRVHGKTHRTRTEAKEFAAKIAHLTDWTQDAKTLNNTDGLGQAVVDIRDNRPRLVDASYLHFDDDLQYIDQVTGEDITARVIEAMEADIHDTHILSLRTDEPVEADHPDSPLRRAGLI